MEGLLFLGIAFAVLAFGPKWETLKTLKPEGPPLPPRVRNLRLVLAILWYILLAPYAAAEWSGNWFLTLFMACVLAHVMAVILPARLAGRGASAGS